jgi:hypothetical protein
MLHAVASGAALVSHPRLNLRAFARRVRDVKN